MAEWLAARKGSCRMLMIPALVKGSYAQQRLLAQAPCPVSENDLAGIYRAAMKYW